VCVDRAEKKGRQCRQTVKSACAEYIEGCINRFLGRIQLPGNWEHLVVASFGNAAPDQAAIDRQRHAVEDRLERAKKPFVTGDLKERECLGIREDLLRQLDALR
jgi:hypothetical protein